MKCNDKKKMLLFGYKESETNLMDLLITNVCVFIAKTHFLFFHRAICRPSEHQNPQQLSENIMQQESWLNQIFPLGEKSQQLLEGRITFIERLLQKLPKKPRQSCSQLSGRLNRSSGDLNWKFQWNYTALTLIFSNSATPTNITSNHFQQTIHVWVLLEVHRTHIQTWKTEMFSVPTPTPLWTARIGKEVLHRASRVFCLAPSVVHIQQLFGGWSAAPSPSAVETITVQDPSIRNVQKYLIRTRYFKPSNAVVAMMECEANVPGKVYLVPGAGCDTCWASTSCWWTSSWADIDPQRVSHQLLSLWSLKKKKKKLHLNVTHRKPILFFPNLYSLLPFYTFQLSSLDIFTPQI